jgi:hypothetical protein
VGDAQCNQRTKNNYYYKKLNKLTTMVIPHSAIPISAIRPNDILLLLFLGGITELLRRAILRSVKLPSSKSFQQRYKLTQLRLETNEMKKLGPSAFVETSKLERKVLSLEKTLKEEDEMRKKKVESVEKILKRVSFVINVAIFLVYYGIPLLTIDGLRIPLVNPNLVAGLKGGGGIQDGLDVAHATAFMKGIMFPMSYVGMGMKLSKLGLGEIKHCSTGALVVFWSSQVMVGKLVDCYEALRFR